MSIKYLIDKSVCYLIRRGPITPMLSAHPLIIGECHPESDGEIISRPAIPTLVIITDHWSGQCSNGLRNIQAMSPAHHPRLIGIQKVFIDLNLLGLEFLSGARRAETRNSKALEGNVFSKFCYLPSFADLSCPELDTSVPLSTWTHDSDTRAQANRLPRLRHQNKPICQNFHSNYES